MATRIVARAKEGGCLPQEPLELHSGDLLQPLDGTPKLLVIDFVKDREQMLRAFDFGTQKIVAVIHMAVVYSSNIVRIITAGKRGYCLVEQGTDEWRKEARELSTYLDMPLQMGDIMVAANGDHLVFCRSSDDWYIYLDEKSGIHFKRKKGEWTRGNTPKGDFIMRNETTTKRAKEAMAQLRAIVLGVDDSTE